MACQCSVIHLIHLQFLTHLPYPKNILTKKVVINPNGTSLSECRHSLCWYTKEKTRIEFCQSTIDGHDLGCIYLLNQLAIIFRSVDLCMWLSSLQLTYGTWLSALQPAYISICRFPLRKSRVIRELPISIVAYTLVWP